jgi:transcriptional regulator with XRE-family HTH domain
MHITSENEFDRWNRAVIAVVTGTRYDADMSQTELARRLHVTRNTVANMETGRRLIQAAELPIIARALGTSMETLMRRIVLWYSTFSPSPMGPKP